jgi:hypothetical protein
MIGGYGKFGKELQLTKTYDNLPEHYKLVITFDLW